MPEQLRSPPLTFFLSILLLLYSSTPYTSAIIIISTITPNQTIKDGDTIVSPQQTFELGFFSPNNSTNRYVGIWYKKISTGTVIWVANRNTPLTNFSGELSLTTQGNIIIRTVAGGDVIWSSNNTSALKNPVGQLLDTGNLIVMEETGDRENPTWQSFDFPTDTFLPGMKFGKDLVTGREIHFTSWKTDVDPSSGGYSVWIDTHGYPQMIVKEGMDIRFRAGPWNGDRFSGEPNLRPNSVYRFGFSLSEREMYYYFDLPDASVTTRVVIRPTGSFERLLWIENRREWLLYLTPQNDNCDRYKLCGSFGSCNINNSPACGCLKGFEPTSPDQWNVADWSQGCRRSTPLECGADEGFRMYSGVKLPDTQGSWFNQTMTLDECERFCKRNCSCTAYTTQNITGGGSGCLVWFGDLMDIRTFAENGQDLYIRMPASELAKDKSSGAKKLKIILPVVLVLLVILVSVGIYYRFKKRKSMQEDTNKLGEGGFGPVYKGVMEDGQEVAVKRLSRTSTQGLSEFKNEVITISKLQHRNLVRLLGCCIKGAEKMLAWGLHKEGKSLELVATSLNESTNLSEVLRSIHVGLLCVQQRPEDRPTMSSVVLMFASEGELPPPKPPGGILGMSGKTGWFGSVTGLGQNELYATGTW
ncbi:hypothetical protein M8C21_012569 [Ambrosia artemisiifolia]|uniref:Uncharacterized protein n=1 Tax=Ambrosia artemisiifolia TaxID=4212 RepID=A0AAD5GRC3_AMBAR|nr:hypothetical protein M8C21_012569 [Ambrosia artemisiifolia]